MLIHLLELAPEDYNNEVVVLVNGPRGKEMDPNNDANVCNELEDNDNNDNKASAHPVINGMAEDYDAEDALPGSEEERLNGPDVNDNQGRDADSKSDDSMVIVMMKARKMLKNESEENSEDDADEDNIKRKTNDEGDSSNKDDSKESSKGFQEQ
jgi:hypothetical protein